MRSLKDLYVRGTEVTLDDGTDDPVVVWVQKLNPVEHEAAIRKADAMRSRVLSIRNDKDSEEYQAILSDVLTSSREVLIGILSLLERGRIAPVVRAELADKEEWKQDNYLQGLQESWDEEMQQKFVDDPEDAEAARIHSELERFLAEVQTELDDRMSMFDDGLDTMTDDELQDQVVQHNIKVTANVAWLNEYNRQCVLFATRDTVKRERVFSHRSEIDDLQLEVLEAIKAGLDRITVEPLEGKESAAKPPSSPSSEQPDREATEESSGPTAAAA